MSMRNSQTVYDSLGEIVCFIEREHALSYQRNVYTPTGKLLFAVTPKSCFVRAKLNANVKN